MQIQWMKCFINWQGERREENEFSNGTQIEQIVQDNVNDLYCANPGDHDNLRALKYY